MPIQTPFEPTKSFCYRVARYELLDLIAQEPEAKTYQPFRMIEVTKRIIKENLTPAQLAIEIPAAEADRVDTVFDSLKFFVQLHAKRLSGSPFIWLGNGGMYRLKDPGDIEQEIQEAESEALELNEDQELSEYDGWIYAFSFPMLIRENGDFPIKIGKTAQDVDARVAHQCRSSASFDNPKVLGRWQVKRVTAFEQALHATLKVRGKWRENVPGTEWFDSNLSEIERLVSSILGDAE
jgi:hypothetical protein